MTHSTKQVLVNTFIKEVFDSLRSKKSNKFSNEWLKYRFDTLNDIEDYVNERHLSDYNWCKTLIEEELDERFKAITY